MVVKDLPGGCSGVGRGTAHVEASMEQGPRGKWFAVEVQIPDGQQELGLEKEAGTGSSHQSLECKARSLNFILCAGPANKGFQQIRASSESPSGCNVEDRLEGVRPEVGRLSFFHPQVCLRS